MAQFAKATFSHASYAAFRPIYPPALYNTVLEYHNGSKSLCVDLGTGHGLVANHLASSFDQVIGTDPSNGMIGQTVSQARLANVEFKVAPAENLPFVKDQSVDMIVSGQAAHWFDQAKFWPEMSRIIKPGGTIALWCYKDHVFVDSPIATKITDHYAYGDDERLLGPYWEQPGRSRLRDKLHNLKPPTSGWEDVQRIEYEPTTNGARSSEGAMFLGKKIRLGECEEYVRTWSSFHAWQEKYPQMKRRQEGGEGDIVDEMFEKMVAAEPRWQTGGDWKDIEVDVEWGSGLLLARHR